jgi:hypothetical protein
MYYRALTETERKNSKKGTGVIVELFYSAPWQYPRAQYIGSAVSSQKNKFLYSITSLIHQISLPATLSSVLR